MLKLDSIWSTMQAGNRSIGFTYSNPVSIRHSGQLLQSDWSSHMLLKKSPITEKRLQVWQQ